MTDGFLNLFVNKLHESTVDLELDFVGLTSPTIMDMRRIISRIDRISNGRTAMISYLEMNYLTDLSWPQNVIDVLAFVEKVLGKIKASD